jgi:hypothetical protein
MSAPIYLNLQKILPLTINVMVGVVKCCVGVLCCLKNSTYCKFFYRHHQLTSDNRSNVSERESRTSKARSFRGKETDKFHTAGGKPAPIGCGGKPNQIGTHSSNKNLNHSRNDFPSWARRHAVCYPHDRAWPFLPTRGLRHFRRL